MGNEVSLSRDDIQAGPTAVQARIRAGVNPNKRMLFPHDVGPLPKGCKCTPLGFAILSWNLELLDTLLAAGAEPHKRVGLPARFDLTPLQLAVALGFAGAVRRLLERGADANAPLQLKRSSASSAAASRPAQQQNSHQNENSTPLQTQRNEQQGQQTSQQHRHRRHLLQRHRPGDSAGGSGGAAAGGPAAAAAASAPPQLLLPDCLARAKVGDAPLHVAIDCAAEFGVAPSSVGGCRVEVVEALIGHSSTDLNRLNARSRTPLYKACKRRIEVFVALLATHPGVDVNAGRPLFAAIKVESPQLVRALLQAGAGPTCAVLDEHSRTPLSYALRHGGSETGFPGRAEVVKMLVEAGSRVSPGMLSYAEERGWQGVSAALRTGLPPLAAAGVGGGDDSSAAARNRDQGNMAGDSSPEVGAADAPGAAAPPRRTDAVTLALLRLVSRQQQSTQPDRAQDGVGSFGASGAATNSVSSYSRSTLGGRVSSSNNTNTNNDNDRGSSGGVPAARGRMAAELPRNSRLSSGATTTPLPTRRWPSNVRTGSSRAGGGGGSGAAAAAGGAPWLRGFSHSAPRPTRLTNAMQQNPLLLFFFPVLFPILIIEPIIVSFTAIGEALMFAALVGLGVLAFMAPAVLYGLYWTVGRLTWLLRIAFKGPADGDMPDAALLDVGREVSGIVAARAGAAAPSDTAGSGLLEAAAAATEADYKVVDPGLALLDTLAAATTMAPDPAGVVPHTSGIDGTDLEHGLGDTRLVQPPLHLLQPQRQATCASTVATAADAIAAAAAAASPTPSDHRGSEGGGMGSGSVTNDGVVGSCAGSGPLPSPAFTLTRALLLLWQGYISIFVAIAALVCALFVVRICFDAAEAALRRSVPERSRLGAHLTARARRRDGGGVGGLHFEGHLGACMLLLALALRWFGGASFSMLLLILTASAALLELAELLYGYVQQYGLSWSNHLDGRGGDGSSGLPVEATAAAEPPPPGCSPVTSADAVESTRNGSAGAADADGGGGGLDGMCCVCMTRRAVMGFVHRDVVHCCMCMECENVLRKRGSVSKCLICKRAATTVAKVVIT